jgi:ATP-dependent RNA helicase DDX19/DBP5
MADEKTPPPSDASGIAKSFEERLTFPSKTAEGEEPKKFNWADEAETPTTEDPPVLEKKKDEVATEEPGSVESAQQDGANTYLNGSKLDEPEFDVNVKLADLQEDPNNPLYSVQSFEDLKL